METARDLQTTIGPSDMSDPCGRCIAFKMAGTPIPRAGHTLHAWFGTGIHGHLEHDIELLKALEEVPESVRFAYEFFTSTLTEVAVPVLTIPGYGDISGHIDLLGEIPVDWKSASKKKIADWKKELSKGKVPIDLQKYATQLTIYMGAARRLGYNIAKGVLAFIPRDAITPDDFWTYPVTYSEQNEQAAINRVKVIWQYVQAGRHDEIPSDPDCYTCHPRYYQS